MIDKYKYTTLSYSKNGLSCRPFHKEGFYRENPLFTRLFRSFCRQMKLKMPIECLSDASWMSLGCLQNALLARSTSSRTTCLRQTKPVMSPSTCGASRSQKKRICRTQPRKPSGIGTRSDREISKNYLQIRRTQFVLASLQHYIITTLHSYVFIFHFSFSAFRSFAVIKTTPQKTKQGLTQKMISVRRAHQENGLRSFFKELNLICAANKKPPRCLFSDKY